MEKTVRSALLPARVLFPLLNAWPASSSTLDRFNRFYLMARINF